MASRPGKETIAIHILSSISRRRGTQTMRLGQLIEYNMRITFRKKRYTKYGGKTIPDPFLKNQKDFWNYPP